MASSIVIIEDDQNLREGLQYNLRSEGYAVESFSAAPEAERALAAKPVDLIILDVMLPGEDGYAWARRMRAAGLQTMVLMLTARTLEDDIVRGFEAGAQDYVTKPYRLRELLARVAALIRRNAPATAPVTEFADFTLDFGKRELTRATGEAIELTRTEFDLLAFLLKNRDRALARDEILNEVWGRDLVVDPRTVDNFVSSLKKKLGWSPQSGFAIHTIRGVGYRFELGAERHDQIMMKR